MRPTAISVSATTSHQNVAGNIVNTGRFSPALPGAAGERDHALTSRQLEVLSLLCEGLPNKLISARLNISAGTVKIHIGNILRKLGVSSRLQAVISARQRGFVSDRYASASDQILRAQPQA